MEHKAIHPFLYSCTGHSRYFTKGYNKDLSVMLFISPSSKFFHVLLKNNWS